MPRARPPTPPPSTEQKVLLGIRRLENRLAALEARFAYQPASRIRIINDSATPTRKRKKEHH